LQNGYVDPLREDQLPNLWTEYPLQDLPSPDAWRKRIRTNNDGSNPREPYQRCSQAIFEAWLKPQLQSNPLVATYFGWKLESMIEEKSHVESTLVDTAGKRHVIRSQYVIGCDGAGSKVRSAVGIALKGGPV
jgi:2-polyprenyl-6-methoxyphenol hydroxylase-like FAD-dependent oxidoreductase